MVYRLKNWMLLRDLMCANKETAKFVFDSAYKEMIKEKHIKHPPYLDDDKLKNMINSCGCNTISQEGFEYCIVIWKDDLSPLFRYTGESPEFEEFLEELDEILDNIIDTIVERHQL